MVEMYLYVEGGGDTKLLRTACRQAFSQFLAKAGLNGHMPRIVACGRRRQAYDEFCTALRQGKRAMLLVDSEDSITTASPWDHLLHRAGDQWPIPPGSTDDDCHLMVQCMESWFLADRDTLRTFFGQGYQENALAAVGTSVEALAKPAVYQALANATRHCKTKAPYGKGEHSFLLMSQIEPAKVMGISQWAKRFVERVKAVMDR